MAMANGTTTPATDGIDAQVFTLFVNNVPPELEKEGVESIFIQYGQVVGTQVAKNRNGTYAYVSFASYREAEHAIYELNRKPPLMLSVQFKDKRLQDEMSKTSDIARANLSYPVIDHRYKYTPIDEPKDVKAIDLGRANCTPVFQANTYTCDNNLLYPVPYDPSIFNPYEPPGPYNAANLMYTRGTIHLSRDGRRHISCGRGFTYYKLPEPNYDTPQILKNVCEKREQGYYMYASDDTEDDTGLCKICTTPTSYRCQKCSITFYCCRQCQVNDWPKHKLECQPIPPLVTKLLNRIPTQNQDGHNEPLIEPQVQMPTQLRRPKEQVQQQQQQQQQLQTPSSENVNHNKEMQKSPVPVTSQKNSNSMQLKSSPRAMKDNENHQTINENKNDLRKLQNQATNFKAESTSFPTKQQSQQQQRRETENQSANRKVQSKIDDDNIVFQRKSFLPRDTFTRVMVTQMIDKGEYWVQKIDELDTLVKLLDEIKEYVNSQRRRVAPEENLRCVVEYEKTWHRATILLIGNPVCKVLLHDIGTVVDMPVHEVCPLDGQIKEKPYVARHIRIIEGADPEFMELEVGDQLFVKALSIEVDGTIIVQVKDKPIKDEKQAEAALTNQMASCSMNECRLEPSPEQTSELSGTQIAYVKLASLPNVLDTLKVGQTGMVLCGAELSQGEYSVSFVPENSMTDFTLLVEELNQDCIVLMNKNLDFSFKIGDLICGLCDKGDWYRGIVLEDKPTVKLILIDESRIAMPVKCLPLAEKYKTIKAIGLICQLESNTKLPTPKPEVLRFEVTDVSKISEGTVAVTITNHENTFSSKAVIRKWTPRPEQKGIQPAKLNSGDEVHIVDFSSQNLLYLRNRAAAENERSNRLEQEIAKCALNRKSLTQMPVVGQMVLSHYSLDDNYYRAIVKQIEGDKILIIYIDYGNEETLTLDKLFELSDELKQHPSCVTMVQLKNVNSEVPLNEEATSYIQELIAGPVPLICTFSGHPFEDGVELKTLKNENVNERFNLLLKPTWEKENPEEDKKVYTLRDLPILKLGDVGDDIQVIVLNYVTEIDSVVLGPNDAIAAEAIQLTMLENIQKYVATTTSHYIPREEELCIAKYEDQYYRALCIEPSASPTQSLVYFIDYGNNEVVNHEDIRVITRDFLELGSYGTLCSISSVVPEDKLNDKVKKRLKELLCANDFINIKIISVDNDGAPIIDIPSVRVKLIEENLI